MTTKPAPVYFLLHVPKTAGQTIQVHLAEHCAPGAFWQSTGKLRPGRNDGGGVGRGTGRADLPDFARVRVISGHHISQALEESCRGREIRRIVLLRDPLQLQISFYNWQMMDNLAKGLGTYGFELHLRALPRNFISHFLLSRWLGIAWPRLVAMADSRKYEILNRMLADFWFVGAHADCDRVIAAIGADLGIPAIAERRNIAAEMQPQTGWRLITADALSPAERAGFVAQNRLDQALWETWRGAGFEPGGVRPPTLGPGRGSGYLMHEAARPWFALGRSVRRRSAAWLRPGAGEALSRANRARDAAEWEAAAQHYREALRALPDAWAIWVQYGHALKESGNVAEAERAYRRAIGLSAEIADSHLQLGHALKLQGRIEAAEMAYLRAAALDPLLSHPRDELLGLGWTVERIAEIARRNPGSSSGGGSRRSLSPAP